ncbi:MAG: hypothetical protein WCK55_11625 [Verrucomicrobiota bacterium]
MNRASAILTLCILLVGTIAPGLAKRGAPANAASVVIKGVEYSAPHDAMAFVVANAVGLGKELWRVRIYEVRVNPELERDVQDVFITSLAEKDGALLITNERGEKYALDLKTRKVTRQ